MHTFCGNMSLWCLSRRNRHFVSKVVITWSRLAGMKFCLVLPGSRQCYKLFINYILRLHVKSYIPARQDPSFVLPGFHFTGTKFYHVIATARLNGMKKLINTSVWKYPFNRSKIFLLCFCEVFVRWPICDIYRSSFITGEICMLAVATGEFCTLTVITSEFGKLAVITGEFRKLGVITGKFRMLAVITGEFRMLAVITGEFRKLGVITGEFRKLALLSLRMRSDSYYTCVLKDLLLIWPIVCVCKLWVTAYPEIWLGSRKLMMMCKMWLLPTYDLKVFRYFFKFL